MKVEDGVTPKFIYKTSAQLIHARASWEKNFVKKGALNSFVQRLFNHFNFMPL